jgi:hypothetical protein
MPAPAGQQLLFGFRHVVPRVSNEQRAMGGSAEILRAFDSARCARASASQRTAFYLVLRGSSLARKVVTIDELKLKAGAMQK